MDRLKICLEVILIGNLYIKINPILIDYKIHNFNNPILYICKNGFVFEKRYNDTVYSFNRLIIPPYVVTEHKTSNFFTFNNNQVRYDALKKLANNLVEFTSSGFFGNNTKNRITFYENKWFVY